MRNRVFHRARIGGITFEGIISADGPYIVSSIAGGVALGVSALRDFQPDALGSRRALPSGWWVVKYYGEARILLPNFDHTTIPCRPGCEHIALTGDYDWNTSRTVQGLRLLRAVPEAFTLRAA